MTTLLRLLLAGLAVVPGTSPSPQVSLVPGLSVSSMPSGQRRGTLTDFDFLAGGLITASKDGRVVFVRAGERPVELAHIAVEDEMDIGLIGVEVAADQETVYTTYTYDETGRTFGRLSAWALDDASDPTALGGERPVLEGIPVDQPFHAVNSVVEAADGSLFVSVGDGGTVAEIDRLALRAQHPNSPNGKILRILPNGLGHPDNPRYDPDAPRSWRSRVWASGFRNPFRFALRPGTETLVVGDVGWKAWEEVNLVGVGDNLGWPCWEGPDRTRGYRRLAECRRLYGRIEVRPPVFAYPHGPPEGPAAITGGVIVSGLGLPRGYQDRYVFGDFVRGRLGSLRLGSVLEGRPARAGVARDVGLPVRIREGPDGALYVADFSSASVWRIGETREAGAWWWAAVVLGVVAATVALLMVGRGRSGRHRPRGSGQVLLVGVSGFVILYVLGALIGTEAWHPSDVWFQADIPRVLAQMTDFDLTRARLHPLFPLVAFPGVTAIEALGADTVTAVRVFTALGGGMWLAAMYATLRAVGCRATDAVGFTALAAVSGAGLFIVPVPESFALGGASMLAVMAILALTRRRSVSAAAEVGASVASFGFTLTNGMAAIAASLVRRPWVRSAAVLAGSAAIVLAIFVAMAVLFPTFRAVPSLEAEERFILHPAAGGPWHSAAAALSHGMVVPEVGQVRAPSGVRALSVQRSWPGTGTPLAPIAVSAWAGLLGLGAWALIRGNRGPARLALALTVAGQVGLHLVYGEEVFVFSPHLIPLLIVAAGTATLTGLRRWSLILLGIVLVAGGVNNAIQLSRAIDLL